MEFSIEVLVKAIAIIIALVVFITIVQVISGGSFNILSNIFPG